MEKAKHPCPSTAPRTLRGTETFKIVFLTLDRYTSISLSNAIDAIRIANVISGTQKYTWEIATLDALPAKASNGLCVTPTHRLTDIEDMDILFVCGGAQVEQVITIELLSALRLLDAKGIPLGSMCTGGLALAAAGLLDGYSAVFHWGQRAAISERFHKVQISEQIFCVDGPRYTCASGPASLYLMLHLVTGHLGRSIAVQVADQLGIDRIRDCQDRQYVPLSSFVGHYHDVLIEVASLMESNLEEPLPMAELAKLVGVSKRQIERLFNRYVGEVPTKYYLNLRLHRAKRLLLETSMTVTQISLACGFQSAPHFSKSYREHFGIPPTAERISWQVSGLAVNGRQSARRSMPILGSRSVPA